MVRQAERQFDLDLTRSFVVGDKASDIALGSAVGATSVLVRTGYGDVELARVGGAIPGAAYVAADLMAATSWVLRTVGHPQTSSKASVMINEPSLHRRPLEAVLGAAALQPPYNEASPPWGELLTRRFGAKLRYAS